MHCVVAFVVGVVLAWPIALCHGMDLERRRWR